MLAWVNDSPLVPLHGGHPTGDSTWAWIFLVLLRGRVRGLRRRRNPGALVRSPARRSRRDRRAPYSSSRWARRCFSPPTRGPTGCTDGSRRFMTRIPIARSPTSSRTIRPSRGSAPTGGTPRPSTGRRSRSPPSPSLARPVRLPTRQRGSTSRSRRLPCSAPPRSPRGCRGDELSLSHSSDGTRCSPCTSRAAGTTTPGLRCSWSARSLPARRASGSLPECAGLSARS